ncbi:MAG: tetratricopeptide repeat protein [Candidatus Aegiribacteria sp.]|nr:tetratricopeptide repeat protein [Candidatus Aegiribacteria sp.]
MLNLVPRLISLNYSDGNLSGSVSGSVLIFDVSGFASMAEILSRQGKSGAEVLSNTLNRVYSRGILSMIRGSGGFVSGFSGDSFAVILPGTAIEKAEAFGKEMLNKLTLASASSSARIVFKAGGSDGTIDWGIFGRERKGWFFSGNALRRAFQALEKPEQGGFALCRDETPESETFTADRMGGRTPDRILETGFFSEKLLNSEPYGEFRRVFPVFLTPVDAEEDDQELIRSIAPEVIQSSVETGGFFNGVHYDSNGFYFLILFGAPEAHENDLERALIFARQIYNYTPFPIRIAISSGTMYAGFLGFRQMGTYTVLGSQINVAARIMRFENNSGIYVSDIVANNTPGSSTAISVRVKGMTDEVSIFKLDNNIAESGGYPYEGKLLGREEELEIIIDLAQKSADDSTGSVLLVSASAGTGKSHLLWEAGNILETQGFRIIHLRCDDIIRRSFGPFVTFLRVYFQQKRDSSSRENLAVFNRIFQTLSAELRDGYPDRVQELERTVSFLSALLGIDMPGSLYHQVGPEGKQENTITALREFFFGLAQTEPLFVVLDDIQWLDDSSESLLRSMTRNLDNLPIVLALAARTHDDGSSIDIPSEKESFIINLESLQQQTLPELVKDILGGIPGPNLEIFLATHSRMNPFYLHQYAVYLVESDSIKKKNGIITLSESPDKIPRGIVDLLTARIDRLSGDLKGVVKKASVLGFEFNARVLSAMLTGRDLTPLLSNGAEEKLWSSVSEIVYIFQHGLLRETAYSMQLENELVKLHSIAACAIENIYPGDETFFPDLAYHWDKAKDSETACFYLDRVLQAAERNGDVKLSYKCIVRLRELFELLPDRKEQLIGVMIKEIQILGIFARCKEAVELAERTEELALSAGDRKRYAEAMGMRAWLTSRLGDLKTALEINEKALEIHNELGYLRGIYESTGYLAAMKFMTGHISEARKLFEKQLRVFEEMKDDDENNAKVYNNMASTAVDLTEKQQILEKAIDVAKQHKDKRLHSVSLGNLADVFHNKNQFEEAAMTYQKALDIAREIGDRYYISYHSCGLAILKTDKGDYSQAVKMLQEYYETSRETGIRYGEGEALGYMAVALMRQGDLERALSTFNQAIQIFQELDYVHYIYYFQADRARTLFLLGRLQEAEAAARESNSLIKEQEKPEAMPENDSLLQRIRFENAETLEEKLDCIRSVKAIISEASDPVSIIIPAHDLWQMIQIPGDDIPEKLSPAILRKELVDILDRAAMAKPTYDIISMRDEIRNDT